APYISQTARHLAAQGYRVHVFTTWPHYPAWRTRREGETGPSTDIPNLVIHRVRTYVPKNPTPVRRLAYETLFALMTLPQLLRAGRFDLYCGCSPNLFSALLARFVGKLRRTSVLLFVQDIVSAALMQTGQDKLPGIHKVLSLLV